MGIFSLGSLALAMHTLSSFPKDQHVDKISLYLTALQNVWLLYMPIVFIIGLLYILSGFLIKKGRRMGIFFGVISALLNILWFAGYSVSLHTTVLPAMPHKFHPFVIAGALIFSGIILCLYPLYYLITYNNIETSSQKPM